MNKLNPHEAPEGYTAVEKQPYGNGCDLCCKLRDPCDPRSCHPKFRKDGCDVYFIPKQDVKTDDFYEQAEEFARNIFENDTVLVLDFRNDKKSAKTGVESSESHYCHDLIAFLRVIADMKQEGNTHAELKITVLK